MRRAFLVLFVAAAGLVAGCGGPDMATVGGEVRVDGKPLDKGTIAFAPADGKGDTAEATVENGRYEVRTLAGKKKVLISSEMVIGRHKAYDGPDAPMVNVTGERLPEKYNANTELEFEVKSGSNTKDWELQGGKSRKP